MGGVPPRVCVLAKFKVNTGHDPVPSAVQKTVSFCQTWRGRRLNPKLEDFRREGFSLFPTQSRNEWECKWYVDKVRLDTKPNEETPFVYSFCSKIVSRYYISMHFRE